jgi:excisionase family DNA binding protein
MTPRLVTIAQGAEHLSVSERTVRRAVADGRLPAVRIGRCIRIRLDDLERLMRPVTF